MANNIEKQLKEISERLEHLRKWMIKPVDQRHL